MSKNDYLKMAEEIVTSKRKPTIEELEKLQHLLTIEPDGSCTLKNHINIAKNME